MHLNPNSVELTLKILTFKALFNYDFIAQNDSGKGTERWRKGGRTGDRRQEGDEKMCYVHRPTPHDEWTCHATGQ